MSQSVFSGFSRRRSIGAACAVTVIFLTILNPHQRLLSSAAFDAAPPWRLIWSDEFKGPDGSGIDPAKWTAAVGGSGWGNHELEYYTNRPANASISGGALVIKAIKENYTGADKVTREYTSGRLTTKNKFSVTYGRIEARLKIPFGQGVWPAFWLLGSNIDSVRWPNCASICP